LTIVDFVEKYTKMYADEAFLQEKQGGKWVKTSYKKTRDEVRILAAGLMAKGLKKGDAVYPNSLGYKDLIIAELGIMYAGGTTAKEEEGAKFKLSTEDLAELRKKGVKYLTDHKDLLDRRIAGTDLPDYTEAALQMAETLGVAPSDELIIAGPVNREFSRLAELAMLCSGGSVAYQEAGKNLEANPKFVLCSPQAAEDLKKDIEKTVQGGGEKIQKQFEKALKLASAQKLSFWNKARLKTLDGKILAPIRKDVLGTGLKALVIGPDAMDDDLKTWLEAVGLNIINIKTNKNEQRNKLTPWPL